MKRATPSIPTLVLLGLITLSALALRVNHLDRPSLWEDDYLGLDRALMAPERVFSLQKFQGPARTSYDFQPPLYYALVHLALGANDSAVSAKMVGAAAGTLAVLAFFLLGRTLYDDRAGLFAALLCALNISHIAASQSIKAYALFHLLNAASFAFLWRGLKGGGLANWVLYCLSGLCLVYASYVGLPLAAGQMLLATGYCLLRKREGAALRPILPFALAAFAIILAGFAPYLEGVFFFRDFMTDEATFAFQRIPAEAWTNFAAGFFFYRYEAGPVWWTAVIGASVLGVIGFVANKKGRFLFLTLLAIAVPVCAALASRSSHPLEYRHFAPVFLPAVLLPACGLAFLCEGLARRFKRPWSKGAVVVPGLALCVLLSLPSLSQLDSHYTSSLSNDKPIFEYLSRNKQNIGYLEFAEYQAETRRLGSSWSLRGLFANLSDYDCFPYRRCYLVENYLYKNATFNPGPLAHLRTAFNYAIFDTDIYVLGLANRSPLVMAPSQGRYAYGDDFNSLALFNDCARAENVFPEFNRGALKASDPSKPARLEYAFLIPEGVEVKSLALNVDAALYKRSPHWPSDSRIVISASRDGGPFEEAAIIGFSDFLNQDGRYEPKQCPHFLVYFNNKCGQIQREIALFANAPPRQALRLRFDISSGLREGHIILDAFRLTARTEGEAQPLAALRRSFEGLGQNVRLVKWNPDRELAFCDSLYAFDLTGTLGCESPLAACNAADDLTRYQAAHPGAKPVYALLMPGSGGRDGRDGPPAVALYDPSLDDPFVRLSAKRPVTTIDRDSPNPLTVNSLTVTGDLDVPSFSIDGEMVEVPVLAPRGASLVLNAGGEGRLYITPRFTQRDYDPDAFSDASNLGRNPHPDEDGCLTCREERPCSFTYLVISAYPIRKLRMENHMRAFMDPARKNGVRALISAGEKDAFEPIEEFMSDGSGLWKSSDGFTRTRVFDKPVTTLKIRYEMTGQGGQIWATKRVFDDMRMTLDLDARTFKPFAVTRNPAVLAMKKPGKGTTGYFFSPTPLPFFNSLRHVD